MHGTADRADGRGRKPENDPVSVSCGRRSQAYLLCLCRSPLSPAASSRDPAQWWFSVRGANDAHACATVDCGTAATGLLLDEIRATISPAAAACCARNEMPSPCVRLVVWKLKLPSIPS